MKKLEKYLEKNGIEFYTEKLGSSYFQDKRAQMHFTGIHVAFEYSDIYEQARKTVETIEKLERYCKRYGYTIFSRFGWYGTTTFRITKSDNYNKLDFLQGFVNQSVASCEKAIHLRHEGFYSSDTDEEFNERLSGTMEYWQDEYLNVVRAMEEGEKIA